MQTAIINAQREIRLNKKALDRYTRRALRALEVPSRSSLNITFIDRASIRKLNKRYFKKSNSTDVIAFEYNGKDSRKELYKGYLGEVVICPGVASSNAKTYGNSLLKELTLYIIHGILHLLGYDDTPAKKKARMQKKENEILEEIW